MSQSNTRVGDVPVVAGEDLTGTEGLLAVVSNDSGTPVAGLPASNDALALYVVIEGTAAGGNSTLRPLDPGRNVRVRLEGVCDPGDVLVLADTATPADKGKVRALPSAAGTYRGLALAEEAGVDGQLVLARPAMLGGIVVTE